jgi:hypothetical protein
LLLPTVFDDIINDFVLETFLLIEVAVRGAVFLEPYWTQGNQTAFSTAHHLEAV